MLWNHLMALADLELSSDEDAAALTPYISPSLSNNITALDFEEQIEETSEEKSSSS